MAGEYGRIVDTPGWTPEEGYRRAEDIETFRVLVALFIVLVVICSSGLALIIIPWWLVKRSWLRLSSNTARALDPPKL